MDIWAILTLVSLVSLSWIALYQWGRYEGYEDGYKRGKEKCICEPDTKVKPKRDSFYEPPLKQTATRKKIRRK